MHNDGLRFQSHPHLWRRRAIYIRDRSDHRIGARPGSRQWCVCCRRWGGVFPRRIRVGLRFSSQNRSGIFRARFRFAIDSRRCRGIGFVHLFVRSVLLRLIKLRQEFTGDRNDVRVSGGLEFPRYSSCFIVSFHTRQNDGEIILKMGIAGHGVYRTLRGVQRVVECAGIGVEESKIGPCRT